MGELEFSSTLVTYWSNGEKISEPGKFQLKHFLSVNKRYNGHEGFWVEGVCQSQIPQIYTRTELT